jgi:ribosomal protein L25 (general stress protein Ctc)
MNHLGHKSKAGHAAYARDAKVVTLPLEHYEEVMRLKIEGKKTKVLPFRTEIAATGT